MSEHVSSSRLHGSILRSVSRSFYLSIRLLPGRLRQPVGLAYLLARATDTLADTAEISAAQREEALASVAWAIQGTASNEEVAGVVKAFVPRQKNEAEQRLIAVLPKCLNSFARLDPADRDDVRNVLGKITQGQALDLKHFAESDSPQALARAVDLHHYTYLVAGSVGEFWTQLCFRHLDKFSEFPQSEMLELGKRYGMGLQLINILRDAGTDLRAGRCYFPGEELETIGLDAATILREPDRFESVYEKWRDEAENGLRSGMQYVHAIRNRRIRAATVLPALIGARTLALLRNAGSAALHKKIKVPRTEVRAIIASVMMRLAGREHVREMFVRLLE